MRSLATLVLLGLAMLVAAAFAAPRAAAPAPLPQPGTVLRVGAIAERILLLQAQIGQGVLAERSRRALAAEGRALVAAVPAAPADAEIHDDLAVLAILAREYRAYALRAPTREHARALAERAEEVVWVAEKVASTVARREHLRDRCEAADLRAQRADLLAQRVARRLLWRRWGIGTPDDDAEQAQLQRALEAVRGSAPPGGRVEEELQLADNQVAFLFDAARDVEGPQGARQAQFIAKSADHLHESLQRFVAACRETP